MATDASADRRRFRRRFFVAFWVANLAIAIALLGSGVIPSARFFGTDGTLLSAVALAGGGLMFALGWSEFPRRRRWSLGYLLAGPVVVFVGVCLTIGLFRPTTTTFTIAAKRCLVSRSAPHQWIDTRGVVYDIPGRQCNRFEVGEAVRCQAHRPPLLGLALATCDAADPAAHDRRLSAAEPGSS